MGKTSTPYLLYTTIPPNILPMKRSKGIHISTCINRICKRSEHYYFGANRHLPVNKFELGNAWELALKTRMRCQFPDRFHDLGQVYHDGLYGTPDDIDVDPMNENNWDYSKLRDWMRERRVRSIRGGKIVEEIKCSWMSSLTKAVDLKYWKYWEQGKSYCNMLGLNTMRLRVFYVNGDYGTWKSRENNTDDSDIEDHIRQFTEFELMTNWTRIKKEAAMIKREEQNRSKG